MLHLLILKAETPISHSHAKLCIFTGSYIYLVFFVTSGVQEAMGVENSGVLYALWSYPAQAADELSFRDGDMVTILQKPEGSGWWWASLCGREGFVPFNYFGVTYPFPNEQCCLVFHATVS